MAGQQTQRGAERRRTYIMCWHVFFFLIFCLQKPLSPMPPGAGYFGQMCTDCMNTSVQAHPTVPPPWFSAPHHTNQQQDCPLPNSLTNQQKQLTESREFLTVVYNVPMTFKTPKLLKVSYLENSGTNSAQTSVTSQSLASKRPKRGMNGLD